MTVEELLKQLEAIRKKAEPQTRDALGSFAQDLKAYGAERDQEAAAREKEIADLKTQLAAKDKEIAAKDNEIADLKAQLAAKDKEIAAKDKEIADLKTQLAGAGQVTRASPSDIAKSFRAVIDEFHAEARESDDVGIAIKTLDLQVKGLVEVDDKTTTLVLPSAGAAVDPTILSTFRVSFGAVPALPAEEAPAPQPK